MNPTTENPRLAKPTSFWNGLVCHLGEEDVHDEIVEEAHSEREEQEPGQHRLGHGHAAPGARVPRQGDERSREPQDEKGQGEVAEQKPDRLFHDRPTILAA
jgi:hypothetical protein